LGDVVERAGRAVIYAEVIDESLVKLDDGRVAEAASLGSEVAS